MDEYTGALGDREDHAYNLTASHRQLETTGDIDPFGAPLGLLSKRDSCSDAFGSGWINSACAPGKTLCCVNERQRYPQCQQALGLGWCCTASEGGCYVDLESSACGQPGAVQCSQLAEGVDEACCPRFTTCARDYNATTTWVRCDIKHDVFQSLEASTTSISGARTKTQAETDSEAVQSTVTTETSAGTTTSTASDSTGQSTDSSTNASTSTTQAPETTSNSATVPQSTLSESSTTSSTQSFSTGATIGIGIGSAIVVLLLAAGAWLYLRKRARAKRQWAAVQSAQAPKVDDKLQRERAGFAWSHRHEMDDSASRTELPGGQLSPTELHGKEGSVRPAPVELEGSPS